ncbi:MAG: hypothetical protein VKP62_10495 [Candidatus Sericytochromatia bacterium]|nr:hypothetical protein [Candidatus Sericytochromatia bacterium]
MTRARLLAFGFRPMTMVGLLLAALLASPARAAEPPAAAVPTAGAKASSAVSQVLELVARQAGRHAFRGVRSQQVIRQDMVLDAQARVEYQDALTHQIALQSPKDLTGLNMTMERGRLTVMFPRETLVFQSDVPVAGEEARDLVLGNLLLDQAALQRNYRVTVEPELDIVALYPCYKLTAEPTGGYGPNSPPGHRFWVAKENGLILKEERFWGPQENAYFISRFDSLSTSKRPIVRLDIPKGASKLKLAAGSPTEMRRFTSLDQARAAGKAIAVPTNVPASFQLRVIDVMSLYGTDLVFLRYDDGLSRMVVTYRTKPNVFLTLVAGAFALALVDKISALSYHAPNNYAVVEKGDYLVYAYGDLYLETLKGIANSVPIPGAPKQGHRPATFAFGLN